LKVLILNDLFSNEFSELPLIFNRFLRYYKKNKLKTVINNLKKSSLQNLSIKLINYRDGDFLLGEIIEKKTFSDYRINLSRSEYLQIKENIKLETKKIIANYLNNLKKSKIFNIQDIQFGKLFEIHLMRYLNKYLGEIEILKKIIKSEKYDKIILTFVDLSFLEYFHKNLLFFLKHEEVEIYFDSKWKIMQNIFNKINLINYLQERVSVFLKHFILRRFKKTNASDNRKNIIFSIDTKNQFNSIKPVIKELKKNDSINPILFIQKNPLPPFMFYKLLTFLRHNKRNWLNYQDLILKNINSPKTRSLFRHFLETEAIFLFIHIFNNYLQFSKFIERFPPHMVTISNEHRLDTKLIAEICKIKKIPTIYIPHAGIPLFEEIQSKREFTYITVTGEYDIDSYLKRGTLMEDIIITGAPRYEKFHKAEIDKLKQVEDHFDKRKYEFGNNKNTILLTTSPFDQVSIKRIINSVIYSIKELNFLNQFIIKIHPSEDGILHKNTLQKLNVKVPILRDYNILELIKSSKLLISSVSTTILEAMIIGTPVIMIDFVNLGFDYIHINPFNQEKFIEVAKTQDQLTEKINRIILDKNFAENYSKKLQNSSSMFSFYDDKESPTQKIVNLILNVTNKNLE
jgi:UDP-N-acetylglucosamine 2-epimerase